uniref:Uncharacterized protein n=1 Tax=Megaselia scalaris TaxID=36166 RepID=T1H3C4_MEGSC
MDTCRHVATLADVNNVNDPGADVKFPYRFNPLFGLNSDAIDDLKRRKTTLNVSNFDQLFSGSHSLSDSASKLQKKPSKFANINYF